MKFQDNFLLILKVNESRYKQCGVTPHFFTGQNLLNNIEKINIDIINWEKVFDRIRQKANWLCQYLSMSTNCAIDPDLLFLIDEELSEHWAPCNISCLELEKQVIFTNSKLRYLCSPVIWLVFWLCYQI